MSLKHWDQGLVLQDALRNASACKVYVHNHLCPVCNSARTSRTHREMHGRCSKIMKQRALDEKKTIKTA